MNSHLYLRTTRLRQRSTPLALLMLSVSGLGACAVYDSSMLDANSQANRSGAGAAGDPLATAGGAAGIAPAGTQAVAGSAAIEANPSGGSGGAPSSGDTAGTGSGGPTGAGVSGGAGGVDTSDGASGVGIAGGASGVGIAGDASGTGISPGVGGTAISAGGTSASGGAGASGVVGQGGSSGAPAVGGASNGGVGSGGGPLLLAGTTSSGGAGEGGAGATVRELAQDQPATASSEQVGNEVPNGNDGSLTTKWTAADGTFPQWWRVDLGSAHALSAYRVYFEHSDRQYTFKVETSRDDTNYIQRANLSSAGVSESGNFAANVSARYVRITVTDGVPVDQSHATWASILEFSVTGK